MEINIAIIGKWILFFLVWTVLYFATLMARFGSDISEEGELVFYAITGVVTGVIFAWWHGAIVFTT